MKRTTRACNLFTVLTLLLLSLNLSSLFAQQAPAKQEEEYVCLPCGRECDNTVMREKGKCSHCEMQLVKKSTVVFKSIQPAELCKYVSEHKDVVLLDVRTKDEFEGLAQPDFGRLKNAINIPIQELEKRLTELDTFKQKEIIVYCSHSHRSPQASYLLTQNGFTNVTNMSGGMSTFINFGKGMSCKID